MASIEMTMPKMGESVMEGTILSWLKSVGDSIDEDESVLEVATDKVDTEIPATHAGVLKEILAEEGDIIQVGKPIAIIEVFNEKKDPHSFQSIEMTTSNKQKNINGVDQTVNGGSHENPSTNSQQRRFYSPLIRNIAKQEQIDLNELENIVGSGKDGRLNKQDVLDYLSSRKPESNPIINGIKESSSNVMAMNQSGQDEIIVMDRMRKIIASRMIESKSVSAHVTSFVEADMSS